MKKNVNTINLLLLGTALLMIVFFIGKMILDIKTIDNEIYQKRVLLEKKYLHGLSLGETTKQIDKAKDKLEKINKVILSYEFTLDFINDLEKTAESLNLEQTIKLTEFDEPNTITAVPLHLSVQGSYDNILKYINQLDEKNYYINIYQISFNSQPSGVTASLSANIYWQ